VLGTSVVFLDAPVTSVALPAIRGDLGGGLAGQQWVTNAYLLALGSLLLIGGSLGDVFGQKRVFLVGVAGFGLTSALCAVASSIPELCAFRSMQGGVRGAGDAYHLGGDRPRVSRRRAGQGDRDMDRLARSSG
jgi:MFS family permease